MDKGEFVGRTALQEQKEEGIKRTLVGLENVDRGIPRDGYKVFDLKGNEVGFVTSGSPAPFFKKNIALAYVPVELSALDTEINVEIRGQMVKCKVIPAQFYKRPKKS
jgi:aminomethyltransferase